MKNIVLVGAGELGSRHLQSLAKISFDAVINVIDPNEQSLNIAKQRLDEVDSRNNIDVRFSRSIGDIGDEVDLCIVATGANVRYRVISDLLGKCIVHYFVLEKVLFQTLKEYELIQVLLRDCGVKNAWVNCPRRMYPFYKKIKDELLLEPSTSYKMTGGNWGLACNGIHFIDHAAFFSESQLTALDMSGLDEGILESKREGYLEFTGKIHGRFKNGSELEIESVSNGEIPIQIEIENERQLLTINESEGKCELIDKQYGSCKEFDFSLPYQSELTHIVVEQILSRGDCFLTSLEESVSLHIPFIQGISSVLSQRLGENVELVQIT